MTNKVVVGVDGSDASLVALRWAAFEARRRDADVLVVSCYSIPVYGSPEGAVYPTHEDIDMFKDGAAAVVGRATELVAEIDPLLVVDGATTMSPAAVAITESARAGDEIVVGATGHTGFIDGLLGSVAMSVVHRSHVPVIVVPCKPAVEVGPTMHKIVVGLDGSAGSLQALEWAYGEALLSGAELTAVHGWTYPYAGPRTSVSEPRTLMQLDAMEELKSSLESLGARLTSGSIHVHPKLMEQSPAEALLEEAKDADLVVVGSRGRGALRSALVGSVSRTVVQHATCPVVIIRQAEG
ncbi:MAG: universal stress protein [Actinomycetota bacterium]|nr:universal stress protein [Actinomycetota bacterium]